MAYPVITPGVQHLWQPGEVACSLVQMCTQLVASRHFLRSAGDEHTLGRAGDSAAAVGSEA